jgi:hypothetical protein
VSHDSEISRWPDFSRGPDQRAEFTAVHRPINTRRQELVLEGRWHFPLRLLDFERFRRWYDDRCPRSIKASYLGGMVYIETGLDWSNPLGRYSYRLLHRKSENA